jgi:NADPH:quinone reductase-like Zn-dependent oxidoreductase
MRLLKRILVATATLSAVALVTLALVLSHDSPCGAATASSDGTTRMKAAAQRCYGSAEVLKLEEVPKPTIADDEVLVKVVAAAVNPLDWHYMRGKPYFMRLSAGIGSPNDVRVGVDFAGTVEAVGKGVTRFKPGDEVFGAKSGAIAQYVNVRESRSIVLKPSNLTFEQAAAIPVAAITALQGLRDQGHLRAGQKVLVNGASGGVGTFAVQIAKSLGAEVTGVCSTRNVDLVKSLGADHVIDYTKQNFTELPERYDLVLDNVGSHSLLATKRVLKPHGTLVIVGGQAGDPMFGPLTRAFGAVLLSPFVDEHLVMFLAETNQADLTLLADLARDGKMTSVIDRKYAFKEFAAAIDYLEAGRARGKVVVDIE